MRLDLPKIVAWKSYEDATENDPPNVGDLGGYVDGTGWDTYIDEWHEDIRPYYEAIRAEVLRIRIWKDGHWHQEEGCPVFEDGTVAAMSMRAWGDMMASIYNERFGTKFWYGDFAWRIDAPNPWDGVEASDAT